MISLVVLVTALALASGNRLDESTVDRLTNNRLPGLISGKPIVIQAKPIVDMLIRCHETVLFNLEVEIEKNAAILAWNEFVLTNSEGSTITQKITAGLNANRLRLAPFQQAAKDLEYCSTISGGVEYSGPELLEGQRFNLLKLKAMVMQMQLQMNQ